jgi:RNA polymerase sigma-70 factor (ECF subfamily)
MIDRRIGRKLSTRVDPEGVVQESFIRAKARWHALTPKPADLDAWVYKQVLDRLIELIRSALGREQDVDRDVNWPAGSVASLVDSHTGPTSALSRAERCEVVLTALQNLDPVDREILEFRYFDGLNFVQIGEILGLSQNAATKRAVRAMVELRDLIPAAYKPPEASAL